MQKVKVEKTFKIFHDSSNGFELSGTRISEGTIIVRGKSPDVIPPNTTFTTPDGEKKMTKIHLKQGLSDMDGKVYTSCNQHINKKYVKDIKRNITCLRCLTNDDRYR